MAEPRPRWLITCSCGWRREASSAWAVTAIARLQARYLSTPGTAHTITIEEPADPKRGQQPDLPLAYFSNARRAEIICQRQPELYTGNVTALPGIELQPLRTNTGRAEMVNAWI